MPGLVGFAASDDREQDRRTLEAMRRLITHLDFYEQGPVHLDRRVAAARVRTPAANSRRQPYEVDALRVWLDGEIYDQGPHESREGGERRSDLELLGDLFHRQRGSEFGFLRDLSGVYTAVVHDQRRQRLLLVTDRHGLRHLYWTVHDGRLVWASELKAFLALPGFRPTIDEQAVGEFLDSSSFADNRTWFEGVKLLPSASVLTWDLRESDWRLDRYWSWEEIRPAPSEADPSEIVEELGRLFHQAVRRCSGGHQRIGVHLSGGLDSRAIVAALPQADEPLHLFTWGRKGCHDIRLASRVAGLRNAAHHPIEISERNWLELRPTAVWWLDGQMSILDMHYLHSLPAARRLIDVNLNGFLGGNVLGGEYLEYPGEGEVAVIERRGRRHIWGGLRLGWLFYEDRPVFFDNELLEFTLGIPAALRRSGAVYHRTLLQAFPDYFERIPWQRTGHPISWSGWARWSARSWRSVRYGLSKRLRQVGIALPDHRAYANYDGWLRQEPTRSWAEDLLLDDGAVYPQYASRGEAERLWLDHQRGARRAEEICRLLTFEIWLRQLLDEEPYPRPGSSLEELTRRSGSTGISG